MLWGFILVSFTSLTVALSLAEICAKYPTSGGAYYWCYRLATPQNRRLVSWINGWLALVGNWTVSLSVTFGTSQLLVAGITIYHPEWVATQWQTCNFFFFVVVYPPLNLKMNLQILSAYWTLLGVIVLLVCLSVKAAVGRHSASFALGHFDASASGWTPGWSFFIGLLPVRSHSFSSYCFSAICMISSMAEEVHNPTVNLPRAIVWQVPVGMATGVVFMLPILFTLPEIATLIAGQPIGVMFTMIMGSRGGGFGMVFSNQLINSPETVFVIGIFCGISICCAASRATWAFARDKALPLHGFFAQVSPSVGVPLNAYLLSTLVQLLLGLIYLGSPVAFNAFVGVAVMCLGASNAMPIAISLMNKREDVRDSPFALGRLGIPLNVIAVVWFIFEIVLFSMPPVIPVTPPTMSGRHHYTGPPEPRDLVEEKAESSSTSSQSRDEVVEKF
ncbi:hypothetical protein L218DRAFT_973720 [Marasmius fiardii PR-910]|nr:hypothetical protein L218DRAFT_973720 [Marasmius fiardii PR-910]